MPQIQLGGQALPIATQGGTAIYGQNNGTNPIYLSTTQDVSASYYHSIVGPGGAFTWPGGEPLYACTDPGMSCQLAYLTNGATVDSGTTRISTDSRDLLGTVISYPAKTTTVILDSSALADYQTLFIKVGGTGTYQGVSPSQSRLMVEWLSQSGQVIKTEAPYFYMSGSVEYTVAVIAPRVRISVTNDDTGAFNLLTTVIGLSGRTDHRYWQYPGNTGQFVTATDSGSFFSVNAKLVNVLAQTNFGTTGYVYPETIAGYAYVVAVNSTASSKTLRFVLNPSPWTDQRQAVWQTGELSTPIQSQSGTVVIPECPLILEIINTSTAGSAVGSVTISWE